VSLDVVTEIYKKERFKADAESVSSNDKNIQVSEDPSFQRLEGIIEKTELQVTKHDSSEEELHRISDTLAPNTRRTAESSASCEVVEDMVELLNRCDHAPAVFSENLIGESTLRKGPVLGTPPVSDEVSFVCVKGSFDDANSSDDDRGCKRVGDVVSHDTREDAGKLPEVPFQNLSPLEHTSHSTRKSDPAMNGDLVALTPIERGNTVDCGCDTQKVLSPENRNEEVVARNGSAIDHSSEGEEMGQTIVDVMNVKEKRDSVVSEADSQGSGGLCAPKDVVTPELNEFQRCQLNDLIKKVEELREVKHSPPIGNDDAEVSNCGDPGNSESSAAVPPAVGNKKKIPHQEDVHAFFSRFSIEGEGGSLFGDFHDTHQHSLEWKLARKSDCPTDIVRGENAKNASLVSEIEIRTAKSMYAATGPLQNVSESTEGMAAGAEMKSKFPEEAGEGMNNLPEHLGLWKSPWQRNHSVRLNQTNSTTYDTNVGITPNESPLRVNINSLRRSRFQSLNENLKESTGYLSVDFYSLYESTVVQVEDEDIDVAPWEYRDVGQRFLHEKSIESRNWFGKTPDLLSPFVENCNY